MMARPPIPREFPKPSDGHRAFIDAVDTYFNASTDPEERQIGFMILTWTMPFGGDGITTEMFHTATLDSFVWHLLRQMVAAHDHKRRPGAARRPSKAAR